MTWKAGRMHLHKPEAAAETRIDVANAIAKASVGPIPRSLKIMGNMEILSVGKVLILLLYSSGIGLLKYNLV